METIQLKNRHGVVININLSTIDSVCDLGKSSKTCFLNIGSVQVEVMGTAKAVANKIGKERGHVVGIVHPPARKGQPIEQKETMADGPFDTETGRISAGEELRIMGLGDDLPPGEGSFARVENMADGPFDTETGLATGPGDEIPPPGDEPGMMGT
jgi:hypothetical protein